MALTKTEAAKLSNDMLLTGVMETIVKESAVLQYLPFVEVAGNQVTYNQENTMSTGTFYVVGDTWVEGTPTYTQKSIQLVTLGGDADVDNFLNDTYSGVNSIEEVVITSKAKAVAWEFNNSFFNGDISINAKGFDGLHKQIPVGQTLLAGVNGADLTLMMVDEIADKIRPGKPDVLFMSRKIRRKLQDLMRSNGMELESGTNQNGDPCEFYSGIPIAVDDFISDLRTLGSGTNLSTIYAVQFGEDRGVVGLEHGGIQVERIGSLETKDATRYRIKWYCGMLVGRPLGAAKLEGINTA